MNRGRKEADGERRRQTIRSAVRGDARCRCRRPSPLISSHSLASTSLAFLSSSPAVLLLPSSREGSQPPLLLLLPFAPKIVSDSLLHDSRFLLTQSSSSLRVTSACHEAHAREKLFVSSTDFLC